jgi:hypothetical protein
MYKHIKNDIVRNHLRGLTWFFCGITSIGLYTVALGYTAALIGKTFGDDCGAIAIIVGLAGPFIYAILYHMGWDD